MDSSSTTFSTAYPMDSSSTTFSTAYPMDSSSTTFSTAYPMDSSSSTPFLQYRSSRSTSAPNYCGTGHYYPTGNLIATTMGTNKEDCRNSCNVNPNCIVWDYVVQTEACR